MSPSGPHDGIGAVVKSRLRQGEAGGVRMSNAAEAAAYLKTQLKSVAGDADSEQREREFLAGWSPYKIDSFEVIYVPSAKEAGGVPQSTSNNLVVLQKTQSLYQFEGSPAAQKMGGRPGTRFVATTVRHPLIVRKASCYCQYCRKGLYDECEPFQLGFGDLFGKRYPDEVADRLAAPAAAAAVAPAPVASAAER